MSSDERSLAAWLSECSDAELEAVLSFRQVSATADWEDFYDAAEALLDPASLDATLTQLPRHELVALTEPPVTGLAHTALCRADGTLFRGATEAIARAQEQHPDAFEPHIAPEPTALPSEAEAAEAERAITAVNTLTDLLTAITEHPISRTGAGPITASDRRRLIDGGVVESAEELDDLLLVAEASDLVRTWSRRIHTGPAASRWLSQPTAQRWVTLVTGFRSWMPAGLRAEQGGYLPVHSWGHAYPLRAGWPALAEQLRAAATRLTLVSSTGEEPSWAAPIRRADAADAEALQRHLPTPIDRLYLQADLTAIAPGPLLAPLDLRLRRMSRRESHSIASTYRFTAGSLAAAIEDGETADSIREFLSDISSTGIPQPLAYLIDSIATRHGRVRVRSVGAHTEVSSDDATLLEAIAVDPSLRALALTNRHDSNDHLDTLSTRVARDAVYWALLDARYPAIATDAEGRALTMQRASAVAENTNDETAAADGEHDRYHDVIARLRAARSNSDGAWREREIARAVRNRAEIVVTVRLPDDSERAFTLEATGLGGGRLRGLDRDADTERTLPLSSILSVTPAG